MAIADNPNTVANFYEFLTVTHSAITSIETEPEGTEIDECGPCGGGIPCPTEPFKTEGGLDYYNCGYIQSAINIQYGWPVPEIVAGSYAVVEALDKRDNYSLHAIGDFYLRIDYITTTNI